MMEKSPNTLLNLEEVLKGQRSIDELSEVKSNETVDENKSGNSEKSASSGSSYFHDSPVIEDLADGIHTYIHTYVYIYVCMIYVYTHLHIQIHIYILIYTRRLPSICPIKF
jgi:hypothetical protein